MVRPSRPPSLVESTLWIFAPRWIAAQLARGRASVPAERVLDLLERGPFLGRESAAALARQRQSELRERAAIFRRKTRRALAHHRQDLVELALGRRLVGVEPATEPLAILGAHLPHLD